MTPGYLWFVEFDGGIQPSVRADTEDEAKVLAQAMRIKAGQTWQTIKSIVRVAPQTERKMRHANSLA